MTSLRSTRSAKWKLTFNKKAFGAVNLSGRKFKLCRAVGIPAVFSLNAGSKVGEKAGRDRSSERKRHIRSEGKLECSSARAADLLATLRLVRNEEPEITILGIQPGSTGWETDLSPEVHAALPDLLDAAIE